MSSTAEEFESVKSKSVQLSNLVGTCFRVKQGFDKIQQYDKTQFLCHFDLNLAPSDLRHSAITNRVLDWNEKVSYI